MTTVVTPLRALALVLSLLPLACSSSSRSSDESASALGDQDPSRATIRFRADGSTTTSGTIMTGRPLAIVYDEARMPTCRGEAMGSKQWTVTGYYRIGGGDVGTFYAAGVPIHGANNVIQVPARASATDVELWFENTNRWGCHAWDSNFGQNFHFAAQPPPEAPQWAGDVRYGAEAIGAGFAFDEASRTGGDDTRITFRVFEPGITDHDNADAWKDLDVEIHSRRRHGGDFETAYVTIDGRQGNDLRYAVDARALDPLAGHPTSPNECANLALSFEDDRVHSTVEFYFTVNGVELRPSSGETFRASFYAPASRFGVCGPHH